MGADVLRAYSTLQAARSGQLPQYIAQQASLLNNPAVRAGLVNNPSAARMLGLTGGQSPLPTLDNPNPNTVNVPQYAWQPNLPPLDPVTGLRAAQAQAGLNLQSRDPTTFNVAYNAGTPEDIGNIIQRAGPQGLSNVVARTGGLGMYQTGLPQQVIDLGNGQYGITDVRTGGIAHIGQFPGASAAATEAIKQANEARRRQALQHEGLPTLDYGGGTGPPRLSPGPPIQTTKGPLKVPSEMTAAAPGAPVINPSGMEQLQNLPTGQRYIINNDGTIRPSTTTPPPAAAPPQAPPPPAQGTFIPLDQLDPNTPATKFAAPAAPAQPPQVGQPSPAFIDQQGSPTSSFVDQSAPSTPPGAGSLGGAIAGATAAQPPPSLQDLFHGLPLGEISVKNPDTGATEKYKLPGQGTYTPLDIAAMRLYGRRSQQLNPQELAAAQTELTNFNRENDAYKAGLKGLSGKDRADLADNMQLADAFIGAIQEPGLDRFVGRGLEAKVNRGIAGYNVLGDPEYRNLDVKLAKLKQIIFQYAGKRVVGLEYNILAPTFPDMHMDVAQFNAAMNVIADGLASQLGLAAESAGPRMSSTLRHSLQQRLDLINGYMQRASQTPLVGQ